MVNRILVSTVVAAAAILGTAGVASARDVCSGVYEIDGCQYCSYNGSASPSSAYYCDNHYSGYYWSGCSVWVGGICLGGSI